MTAHTKPLAATIASVLVAASLVVMVMATPAHALGPNAIVSGFNSTVFGPNDDGTYPCIGPGNGDPTGGCPNPPAQVALPFTINYFGTNYNKLFLNNNGNVTFDARLATFTPFNLFTAGRVIIAPFFADVDTRVGNTATFGTGTVDGHTAWGANWPGVGCFNQNGSVLDYFQMLIIDRSDIAPNDFDIEFNYDQIQWDSGQASGGDANCLNGSSARAGYSNGTSANSFEIAGSGVSGGFLDSNSATGLVHHSLNSTHLGRYIFSVRGGQPTKNTTLTTSLSGGGHSGTHITVPASTAVTDSATLSGQNAASAGGSVTYTVYSDGGCNNAVASGGTKTVTNGSVAHSNAVSLANPGTYYWRAVYSGDTLNNGSVSSCGAEVETVGGGDPTAPSCRLTASFTGPPKGIQVTVQDGGATDSGLKSVVVTKNVNANVVVPAFTQGTKNPVVVTATRVDNNVSAQVALRVTDVSGNVTNCDPVLTTIVKETKAQVFTDVPAAEHLVTVINNSPGLRLIAVTVNGTAYRRHLQPGQEATIDVVESITAGSNTFGLRGSGPGSADIIIWDGNGTI